MKTIILLIAIFFYVCEAGISQEKKLTIYDCEIGRNSYLKPNTRNNLIWRSSTGYTYKTDQALINSEIDNTKDKEILHINDINEKHADHQVSMIEQFPTITWVDQKIFRYKHDNKLIFFNARKKSIANVINIPSGAENIDISPNQDFFAFTIENDLFINDRDKGTRAVAESNSADIVFGHTVHRNEFGISKGTYWSPRGNYLAFYRNDESEVTSYPLVSITEKPAENNPIKYPMAGASSEQVTIGIYHLSTGQIVYLQTGEPGDKYLTNIQWSPDEKYIYLAELNRDQSHMKLQRYHVNDGGLDKTLFEERHEKYTEPQHPMVFLPSDATRFIWQTRRDGYNHLYLYDTSGDLIKQLTSGKWEVTELLGINDRNEIVFFQATKDSPIEKNIYAVNIKSGEIHRLNKNPGVHAAKMNKKGTYLINSYTNKKVPREINIIDAGGNSVKNILTANNPLKEYSIGPSIISTIKAEDEQTDLYYRLVLPADFDSTKTYPVIVYVYNGPHVQLIENSWPGRTELWQHYMAQNGYISFTLDGRGSANRGLDFENVTFRQLGIIEMKDQMKGIDFIKSLPYVDKSRIGVYGWSYGGFMTTSLMVNHPGVFKVGVAGGPVMDWRFYEVMYTERYMDTPKKNPAGYEKTSLFDKAAHLQGKLLLIHGAQDPVVVWQHSLKFLQSCIENRKQVDYFVYPTHEHNVRGIDRVHLTEMISKYFMEHLNSY